MRKLLYVVANTYVFSSSAGTSGGVKHLTELLKRLELYGFSYKIIAPEIGRAYLEKFGVHANLAITSSIDGRYGLIFPYLWSMLKSVSIALKLPRECTIYSESDALPNIFPAFVAKLKNKNIRWATAFHLVVPNPLENLKAEIQHRHLLRGILSYISQRISVLFIKSAVDVVFTGDRSTKASLAKMGIISEKIRTIKMGVDVENISSVEAGHKIYDACFIGRFHPQKGIYDLIEIWDQVCAMREHSRLVIIGSGDEFIERDVRDKIQHRSTLNGNVELLGFRFGEEYYKIIKSSKLLLFPSKHEGNPIVPLDSMACGVPVIAYKLQTLTDMYSKGIIMVPNGLIDQFARKVLDLLENEKELEKLSLEAFELASSFDWNVTIRELVNHLNQSPRG
jgi:glycosyltransferase involved in cell wall biosynthesis